MRQMIYHLVGHEILNITVYFSKCYYFQILRYKTAMPCIMIEVYDSFGGPLKLGFVLVRLNFSS